MTHRNENHRSAKNKEESKNQISYLESSKTFQHVLFNFSLDFFVD